MKSFTACLIASMSIPAWAGGFEIAEQSAAAAGAANASTARSGDPSAAWFNPAALADGGGLRVGAGMSLAASQVHSEAAPAAADGPWQADTDNGISTPPYLHASWAQDDWAVGLSFNVPFASRVVWPGNWAQRFDIISSKPLFFRVAPFFAYRIEWLRFSAGPQFDFGRLDLVKATNHIAEEGRAEFNLNGHGFGFHLSTWAEPIEDLSFGLTYKSRTWLSLSGNAYFDVPDAFVDQFPDQPVSATWTLPDRLAAGVAYQIGTVQVLTDVSMTLWSVNDRLVLDLAEETSEDREVVNDWRNTVAMRVGAEWQPAESWVVRGGAFFDGIFGAPPPNNRLSPSSPDSRRVGFTLGGSKSFGDFAIDLYYEHMRLLERESTGSDAPLARYHGYANLVGAGLRYN